MDGSSGRAPSLRDRNGKIPVCVSAEAAAVMNDPAAPADECVIPDCLRSPAVAIRMSSSQRRDAASGALVSRRGLPPSHAALLISALLRVCVDVSAFIQPPLLSRCILSSEKIGGRNKSFFCLACFPQGNNKTFTKCVSKVNIGIQHVGESRLMW